MRKCVRIGVLHTCLLVVGMVHAHAIICIPRLRVRLCIDKHVADHSHRGQNAPPQIRQAVYHVRADACKVYLAYIVCIVDARYGSFVVTSYVQRRALIHTYTSFAASYDTYSRSTPQYATSSDPRTTQSSSSLLESRFAATLWTWIIKL